MPSPSSLSSSARRALRAAAHHLDPVVMMGQHGLTPAVLHEIDLALTAHALIKVRAGSDERETRDTYLAEICQKLGCESVQHLGKLFVLWRNADGASDADENAEHDAAAVKASNDPQAEKAGRGPRAKLASERANERAGAPPARSGSYARAGAANGPRGTSTGGARSGAATGARSSAQGERRRYGEPVPDAPRREGWAPKDRRGAARFGATEGSDDTRRRDGNQGYAAPRGRVPAGGGYAGSGTSGGGRGRSGFAGNAPSGTSGRGGYGDENRGGAGGGRGGYQGTGRGRSDAQGDAAARARWGDRREPAQGGSGNQGSAGGAGGGYGSDQSAPKERSSYGRNSESAGASRPPRTGGGFSGGGGAAAAAGGRGGWGNRDGVTGKPSGFSRGGAGGGRGTAGAGGAGTGGAAPRARRRFG